MEKLNETYRGKEGSTDVLSFEINEVEEEGLPPEALAEEGVLWLGEVVVNKDLAEKQAKELGHSFEEEVAELVKHGVLHLLETYHR